MRNAVRSRTSDSMSKEQAANARAKAAYYRALAVGSPGAGHATYVAMAEWWVRFARELDPTPDKPAEEPPSKLGA